MKFLFAFVLLFSLALTGCSNVKTYVFKQDRVDQRTEGNRGYIIGTPPHVPAVQEVPKRTLIGIDIEVPILPGEKGYEPYGKKAKSKKPSAVIEEEIVIIEEYVPAEETVPAEKTNFEPKKETKEGEEWIK